MNSSLKWFLVVTWIGVVINFAFAIQGFFVPMQLHSMLGGEAEYFITPWLGNVGMLLTMTAIFSLPAAYQPVRYSLFAWMAAWSRIYASTYWSIAIIIKSYPVTYWQIPATDFTIGVISLFLLKRGLSQIQKPDHSENTQ